MSGDDLEHRLRRSLADRAGQVDPHLSGPALRARAAGAAHAGRRRAATVLASAAAVVLVAAGALGVAVWQGDRGAPPVSPGGPAPATSVRVGPSTASDPARPASSSPQVPPLTATPAPGTTPAGTTPADTTPSGTATRPGLPSRVPPTTSPYPSTAQRASDSPSRPAR
ncbi:hypothetical protein [Jatrophihabitans fulvus]